MSGSVTTTTKVFPTQTDDVTPASDDRVLISDTSDSGKVKDVALSSLKDAGFVDTSSNQDIDGDKDFMNRGYFGKDNQSSGGMMKANGLDHVYYAWLVNLSRRAYIGFAGAGLTALRIVNEFTNGDIDLQPGSGGNLIVQSQNRTGAWTSYTPTVTGSGAVGSYSTQSGKYKVIGKICYMQASLMFNKGTLGGDVGITLPISPTNSSNEYPLYGWCENQGGNPTTIKGLPFVASSQLQFISGFKTVLLSRSTLGTNVVIQVGGMYEIA